MSTFIEILININMLIFSFSLVQIFIKLTNEPYLLEKRIYFLFNIFNKKNISLKKNEKKNEIWINIGFFLNILIFTIIMISYFIIFYQFIIQNFDDRFWYVFRLICTPFMFIILPYFLPRILNNLLYGFFPKNLDEFDRKKIKLNKIDYILNWIYFGLIIIILTIFISWEQNIIWLSLLILSLIIILIIFRLLTSRKIKYR
jgi:hypothetical protein